jgi:cell division protein FtsN
MRRQVRKSSGAAGLFVLIGFLTILGVTFLAGTYAGRIWATKPHAVASAPGEREPRLRGGDVRVPRIAEPAPRLTFYQELTAPLTAPPPPPKPAKTSAPPLVAAHAPKPAIPERFEGEKAAPHPSVARDGATSVSNRPPTGQAGLALPATTGATSVSNRPPTGQAGLALPATTIATRFTVQVGAYRLRPPADALRATLTAAGHDARVVETDAPNGVRFRVQIGDFASREAARDAAVRLPGPTFVTTR